MPEVNHNIQLSAGPAPTPRPVFPLHPDVNVSPADYRANEAGGILEVTSIFPTFQGEGPHAGRPAVFLRLAGCNIGKKEDCQFCDTFFTRSAAERMTIHETSAALYFTSKDTPGSPLIVVTGGEPLLQWPVLRRLISHHRRTFATEQVWQIETNGMYLNDRMLDDLADDELESVQFVVSPKASSALRGYPRSVLDRKYPTETVWFKFVVEADPSSIYHELPLAMLEGRRGRVYVSGATCYRRTGYGAKPGKPMSIGDLHPDDLRETLANYAHAARLAMKYGFTVSFQTHLFAGVE